MNAPTDHKTFQRPQPMNTGYIISTTGEPTNEPTYYLKDEDTYNQVGSYEQASAAYGRRLLAQSKTKPIGPGLYPHATAFACGVPVTALSEWKEYIQC